ncbi:hypothetical protein ALC57_13019, partial [Trachymyrmex cornetzi]
QRAATTRWSGEPCDLVEQFISHYLRQCGYLGAKGCVQSLKCATSLPREEKEVNCEGRCAVDHAYTLYAPPSLLFFDMTEEKRVKQMRRKKGRAKKKERDRVMSKGKGSEGEVEEKVA